MEKSNPITETKNHFDITSLALALHSYLECALWSSVDEEGEPMDDNYGVDDCSKEFINASRDDVDNFYDYCEQVCPKALEAYKNMFGVEWHNQFGHDFWLTRNGHGAGFWDRGLGEHGNVLTRAAKTFSSVDLYVNDNGEIDGN